MPAAIEGAVASTTSTIVDVFTTNLPVVMVVFAGLIGLGIVVRLIKRYIGRKGA